MKHSKENPFEKPWTSDQGLDLLDRCMNPLVEELHRIVEKSDKWDGRVESVQVTDATPQAMEVRALISATNSSHAWDLRCQVREKLIDFLQKHYPGSLPKVRAEFIERPGDLSGEQKIAKSH